MPKVSDLQTYKTAFEFRLQIWIFNFSSIEFEGLILHLLEEVT